MSESIGTQSVSDGALNARAAAANAEQAFDPTDGARMDKMISEALASIANGLITAGAPFCVGCYEMPAMK